MDAGQDRGQVVVGRETELASVHAFVDDVRPGPRALVLEGEAGIGKSTLWRAGIEHGQARGLQLLRSRPSEAERSLGYVGLGDLLEPALDEVLPVLSPPRRRALEVALLLESTSREAVDPRAVGIATRDALELNAEDRPLLIAIDDLQWFDASSANALAFALRRLGAHSVLLLLARREFMTSPLEHALDPERTNRITVGPLSVGAIHRVLRDRLGTTFPRQTLVRIHEQSGGNPFFAVELAGAGDSKLPRRLDELLRSRLSDLPSATRNALAFAAAIGNASNEMLEQLGITDEVIAPAVAAGVIVEGQDAIRFAHPLLSSVLYGDLLGAERRAVHARIAEVADDPLLRARHLALSRDRPKEEIALVLEDAARVAIERAAWAVAAELGEHALRLTPASGRERRHRRALAAARAHHVAGEWTRARAIANELLAESGRGSLRADALVLLAELESADRAVELLDEALAEAAERPALQSLIHCRLAWVSRFRTGYVGALEHARAALALAERLGDNTLRGHALLVQSVLGWIVGDPGTPVLTTGTHDLATPLGGERLVQEATFALVSSLPRHDARTLLEREHDQWRERDEPRTARALWGLSWIEFWDGDWTLAADYAARAHDISIQYGLEVPQDHLPIAVIAVHRGRLELARSHSERALALAQEQFMLHPPQHMAVLGLVAAGLGDRAAALEWFERAEARASELGWRQPGIRWWTGDHVELLLELGRVDDAVRVLDAWHADATLLAREQELAHAVRCRGLVAAASGDVGRSIALLEEALARHEAIGDPFGKARTLLALGVVRRRNRQKRPAHDAIATALEGFEALGAEGWASKARAELGRIGGRARQEGLTAAERRVAALVADGRTNEEVAAALFLQPRTVASHLTHIYAKLGVRSRTELARKTQAF